MVAQKRARGGKAQAKTKPAASTAEDQPMDQSESEQVLESSGDNGDSADQAELSEEALLEGAEEEAEGGEAEGAEGETSEAAAAEKKEEKVESGKLLIENLPASYLFEYQEKLKELFCKYGEVIGVKRGPIIVTELTTTPTLSAIVEFKNKDSLDKALVEEGTVLDGSQISVAIESRAETAILVGVPYEASTEYVRQLFGECGEIQQIQEFSKAKYKILRVTFHTKESVDKALKLDRELRINGFLVTVSKYRDEEEQKAHTASVNKNKRQHSQNQNRNNTSNNSTPNNNQSNRANFRGRGGAFNARGTFRGSRGRGGFSGRGGGFPRGAYALSSYMPPAGYMGRPGGFMMDGQRPNKRLRQM